MALKGVDAFVKQSGKQHVIQVYRKRGKHYRNGFFVGRVIACRNAKTATVLYETGKWTPAQLRHTTRGYRQHTKAHIHDEYEICNPGDIVMFKHANPHFSKIKKFGLVEVIRAEPIWEDYPAWEGTTEGDFHLTHPNDPDRDDIESQTQRALKYAHEIKERAKEYKQKQKQINKNDKKLRADQANITKEKLKSWRDQVSKYAV